MERLAVLKQLSFGNQVAEDETNELASYFVETDQWARISRGEIDIIRGEKGAGKSAIYSLLLNRADEFFDNHILLVAAESLRGTTVFKDLVADPPTSEIEFIVLWELYIITIVAQRMREFDIRNKQAERVYRALEDARMLEREFSLTGVLRRVHEYARSIIKLEAIEGGLTIDPATQMPSGITGRIVIKEPSGDQKRHGLVSVDSLFLDLNDALSESKFKIWVLLDRLDVAFTESHALEANALRALVRIYADIRNFGNIVLKIFLREDIWKRINITGFREATHITKFVVLEWSDQALLNLIMRRLLNNQTVIREFGINQANILQDANKQEALFGQLFPAQVDQGSQKPTTFKWIISRCRDGTGKTAPREVIYLLNCVRDEEIKRLEHGGKAADGNQLFDRSVFKLALPKVSDYRLHQFLYAEYPNERPYVERLETEKSEQTPESLAAIWRVSAEEAMNEATKLVELGFFEKRGTRDEPTFWVPFLYRDALELVQGRAEEE